jgi:prevent-host-death family protein
MKFVSTRELRNRPGSVRDLAQTDEVVLTVNGKPIAILLGIEEENLEETTGVIRQAKAQRALSRLRKKAVQKGSDQTAASTIEAEIRAVRSKRRMR